MQVIESGLFTVLVPDKGYKLVNKTTGKYYKKVYLGKIDSVDNYGEVVDEKYVNMDYVVELDEVKNTVNKNKEQNEMNLDLLLLSIDKMYTMFEPMLAAIPMTMSMKEEIDPMVNIYIAIVQRGLKDIEEVPERYREQVRGMI